MKNFTWELNGIKYKCSFTNGMVHLYEGGDKMPFAGWLQSKNDTKQSVKEWTAKHKSN